MNKVKINLHAIKLRFIMWKFNRRTDKLTKKLIRDVDKVLY